MSLIIAYTVRHKVSGVAQRDLIDIITTILPHSIPRSKYYFDKYFFNSVTETLQHNFYCGRCEALISEDTTTTCTACGADFNKKEAYKNGTYFLSLSLENQIRDLFENHNLDQHICRNSHQWKGKLYNEHVRDFLEETDNITLTLSADGAPVFKSSNGSFWPVFCTINEVDQGKKKEFIMMHSL